MSCRSSCLSGTPASVHTEEAQSGQPSRNVGGSEGDAVQRLVNLKRELRSLDTETFWGRLMEGVSSVCGAQYAFVARRVSSDEQAHDMDGHRPCLFGTAFYYNDGHQLVAMNRNKYFFGGNPTQHMDHQEPCLVPGNLRTLTSFGPDNILPFPAEGYLAIPLFSDRKCHAYLGLMWSEAGLHQRSLSWSFLEMILCSLEDLVVQRVLEGGDAHMRRHSEDMKLTPAPLKTTGSHPGFAGCFSHPLKPFARSLSHELRTPMHGIVGMLDVMYATIREAIDDRSSAKTDFAFQSLKENIEVVQDSARRAVESADNVVHAYDLNMQVPKTPSERDNDPLAGVVQSPAPTPDTRPNIFIEGSNITNPYKRRRSNPPGPPPPRKAMRVPRKDLSPRSEEVKNAVHESDKLVHSTHDRHIEAVMANMVEPRPPLAVRRSAPHLLLEGINVNMTGPALRCTKLRDLLRLVINESLHMGGRPDFAVSETTELGEKIEIHSRSSNGEVFCKTIDWSIDPTLPDTLLVDDRDFAKLISCVFLNAVKFTNSGTITVSATVGRRPSDVLISVRDTGPGIPGEFLPNIFQPFAREDASTTRSKDGLGLGLLVAKGLSRKMGGDLVCVRSSTGRFDHGSEFEIRVPANPSGACSGSASPADKILTPPYSERRRRSSASNPTPRSSLMPSPRFRSQPMQQPTASLIQTPSQTPPTSRPLANSRDSKSSIPEPTHDARLGAKYPLTFLVAEDNKINRRVIVHMLKKLGYNEMHEACDGREAVRIVQDSLTGGSVPTVAPTPPSVTNPLARQTKPIDVVLMDLWMPQMDGYEATSRILQMVDEHELRAPKSPPTVFAVSADVTDEALSRASKVGMKGYMTKPYKLDDLERLIVEYCKSR